jgi:nucleoside-diphosphate-sugar epimerase
MKILVIGSGFIGTAIIQRLESEGHELLVYSRTYSKKVHSKQVLVDILDFNDFEKMLSWDPQVVIHTAWITAHGLYQNDFSNYRYARFTIELAERIIHTGIEHLIVLGTCAEYGHQTNASTAGVTKLSPKNLYSAQKVATFQAINELLGGSKVRLTWARVFQPYGPMQDKNRLIPYLIRSIKGGDLIRLSDSSSIRDWITTRDIASAIAWAINHQLTTEIDIGTTFGFTNLEIMNHLEELLGKAVRWEQIISQTPAVKEFSIVGRDSPLPKSGWIPTDSLNNGLEWVLNS